MRPDLVMIRRGYITLACGSQIHYRRCGEPAAPTLVLLHQTPSTSQMYEALMLALSDQFDMIALDTPGFGQSDGLDGEFSIAGAAAQLAEAVGKLHIGPVFWFGHHTGAALALQVATDAAEQVAALAMSGPCLLDQSLRERLPQVAAPFAVAADGSHLNEVWNRMRGKDADADLSIIQREACAGLLAGEAYPQAYKSVVELDTQAQLKALQCPTLVFAGTEDPLYGQLADAHALLANGQKAEIPGARTFVCERQTGKVATLLSQFFGAQHV